MHGHHKNNYDTDSLCKWNLNIGSFIFFQVTLWLLLLYLTGLTTGKCHGDGSDLGSVLNNWLFAATPICDGSSMNVLLCTQTLLVCPGEPVTFTCRTIGSPLLTWSSPHYISESGSTLFFPLSDDIGTTKTSPNGASVGNLTNNVNNSDPIILESTLLFNVSDQFSTSQIICINTANGVNATTVFNVGKKLLLLIIKVQVR